MRSKPNIKRDEPRRPGCGTAEHRRILTRFPRHPRSRPWGQSEPLIPISTPGWLRKRRGYAMWIFRREIRARKRTGDERRGGNQGVAVGLPRTREESGRVRGQVSPLFPKPTRGRGRRADRMPRCGCQPTSRGRSACGGRAHGAGRGRDPLALQVRPGRCQVRPQLQACRLRHSHRDRGGAEAQRCPVAGFPLPVLRITSKKTKT